MTKRNRVIFYLLLLSPFFSIGQSKHNRINDLYSYVDQADSLSEKFNRTFFLEKYLKDNYNYKESWRYSEKSGKVFYFEVNYILDSTEYTEVYYLNHGSLVCSEEYEKINYSYAEDELKYGGIYYFDSAVPRNIVVLGKKDHDVPYGHPEYAVLDRFEKRYSELKRHIPMLP
ncbi:MAG: hypothetical protein ABI415_11255 [Flavitalea sp.]